VRRFHPGDIDARGVSGGQSAPWKATSPRLPAWTDSARVRSRTCCAWFRAHLDGGGTERLLLFDDETGQQVDFDLRGTPDEVVAHALPPPRSGPGRPRLGVVSREVSLLPRHWEWLEQQPQGISAALRRLVDEARKRSPGQQRGRRVRDALGRVLWSVAGNLPDFEEATRALFAGRDGDLAAFTRGWPPGVRDYVDRRLHEIAEIERAP